MKLLKHLSLIAILCLSIGCKKEYHTEFYFENGSNRTVNLSFSRQGETEINTNQISAKRKLVLQVDMGTGSTTEDYMNGITEIPFENFTVMDLDSNTLVCDPQDFDCWNDFVPSGRTKGAVGSKYLRINEFSFN